MKKVLFFVLAAIVSFVACEKDPVQDTSALSVKVTAGEATETELTFTVTSANATNCAWVCVAKGTAVPAAADIMSKGNKVLPNGDVNAKATGLNDKTTYVIVAAAMDEDFEVVASAPVEMTTLERAPQPAVELGNGNAAGSTYTFKITPSDAEKCYYKMYAKGSTATIDDVVATGVEVPANEASVQTIKDIADGSYFVVAVAKTGDVATMSGKLEFTINTALPTFTISPFRVAINPDLPTNGRTWIVRFYYYDENGDYENIAINFETPTGGHSYMPAGTYVLEAQNGYKLVSDYTYHYIYEAKFSEGYAVVAINADKTYTITTHLVRNNDGFPNANEVFALNWTGTIEYMPIS